MSFKDKYTIPQEYCEQTNQKNRKVMKVLSYISIAFGALLFLFFTILLVFKVYIKPLVLIYYISLILMGGFGLLLERFKVPVKVLMVYGLFCIELIYLFFMMNSSVTNCLIIFLGLSFVMIMFVEINPFVFTAYFIISISIFICYLKLGFFYDDETAKSPSLVENLVLLFISLIFLVFWKRRHIVEEFRHEIELKTEQKKTESVLKNIFPEKVIQQMEATGFTNAEVYESVTVLYSDIVNFTEKTASRDPKFVIDELNEIFTAFDEISANYNCIRVKTIGDAYVAVCGIPEDDPDHAENIIRCAKDFIAYLEDRNKTSEVQWTVRIGVASGKVAAGVVGVRKFVYDIFGETVDRAVQIEQEGKTMSVTISKETYELVKDKNEITESSVCYLV